MFAEERQHHILTEITQRGRVEVTDLAKRLGVSEDTVRRDLKALSARGYLQKTHGGAVALDPARMPWSTRADLQVTAKRAIGAAAAPLIEAGQTVIFDAGSTVLESARRVRARPLTVITNSLDIAALFTGEPDVSLSVTGGDWNASGRYLAGASTLDMLARRRADWAFLGACALHVKAGLTSVSDADAAVKQVMLAAAERAVVLADATKNGQIAPYLVAALEQLYAVVTDDASAANAFQRADLQVYLAETVETH